ncbi:MAG: hypothetical protein RMJ44_00965 [Cytophagales bacterium]|nr:hypothetical protein [Bernardetiaceae bacterium]MDW8209631.1 hypothetical protein [Cytophagales bacterium]
MFLLQVMTLAVVCSVFQILLPGNAVYTVSIVSLVFGIIFGKKPFQAFAMGFLSISLLWGVYAAWIDYTTDFILGDKVAALFSLPNGLALAAVTGLIGGLLSGCACLSGALLRKLLA